jgi:hypothetical protein
MDRRKAIIRTSTTQEHNILCDQLLPAFELPETTPKVNFDYFASINMMNVPDIGEVFIRGFDRGWTVDGMGMIAA